MVRQDSASKDAQKEKKKMDAMNYDHFVSILTHDQRMALLDAIIAGTTVDAAVMAPSPSPSVAPSVPETMDFDDMLLPPLVSLLPPMDAAGSCMVGKQRVTPCHHGMVGARVKARIGRHECVAIVLAGVEGLDDYVIIKRDPGEGHAVLRHVSSLGAVQPDPVSAPIPSVVPSVPSSVASVASVAAQRSAAMDQARAATTVQPRRVPQGQRREPSVIGSTDPVICPVSPPEGARQFVLVSKDTGKVELLRDGTPKVFGLAQRGGQLLAGHHIAYTPEKLTAFRIDWIG